MKVSRILLRKMIVREVRSVLTNPKKLYESDFVSKLTSGEDVDSVMKTISDLNGLDDIVIDAIKGNEKAMRDAVKNLDNEKKELLYKVIGKLRGSLRASTFTKLTSAMGLENKLR